MTEKWTTTEKCNREKQESQGITMVEKQKSINQRRKRRKIATNTMLIFKEPLEQRTICI